MLWYSLRVIPVLLASKRHLPALYVIGQLRLNGFLFCCGILIKNKLNCHFYSAKHITEGNFFVKFCYRYHVFIGKRTLCRPILSAIILIKWWLTSQTHWYDCRPNWTPVSPVTIKGHLHMRCLVRFLSHFSMQFCRARILAMEISSVNLKRFSCDLSPRYRRVFGHARNFMQLGSDLGKNWSGSKHCT